LDRIASSRAALRFDGVGSGDTFRTFLGFGFEHILKGSDHLIFLLGLWLVCHRIRELVWIVTSFTIAHSLTLAASTLGWVRLPDAAVEIGIAATIAFVGFENLARKGEPKWRVSVTFLFGLLHGFGFSNVLRELLPAAGGGVPALPLLAFNLGVEIGQLAATGVGLPLIWWLRRLPATKDHAVRVGSSLVLAFGLFWMIERLWT